jgi:hypothetical protein
MLGLPKIFFIRFIKVFCFLHVDFFAQMSLRQFLSLNNFEVALVLKYQEMLFSPNLLVYGHRTSFFT